MTIKNIKKTTADAEKLYQIVNDLVSGGIVPLADIAYPQHDGEQDAKAVADIMALRQSANALAKACNILVGKLTDVIGD
nr:MAG TPA: hypothetical protein [Caudoviricetes sp.]